MASVIYEFDYNLHFGDATLPSAFRPFLGFGFGGAAISDDHDNDEVFAYQAIGGLSYALTDNWFLTATYIYFTTDKVDFGGIRFEYYNESLMGGIRFRFYSVATGLFVVRRVLRTFVSAGSGSGSGVMLDKAASPCSEITRPLSCKRRARRLQASSNSCRPRTLTSHSARRDETAGLPA